MFMNFFERKPKESVTSRYVQQNVPDKTGEETRRVSDITDAPEKGIINSLKSVVAKIISFAGGSNGSQTACKSSASSSGANISKSETSKKIEEKEPTSDKAKYTKIKVLHETASGHVILADDTEGNERLLIQHANGSYVLMDFEGDLTEKTNRDKILIVQRDMKINVVGDELKVTQGDEEINIKGNTSKNINGESQKNVDGNSSTLVSKDENFRIGGNKNLQVDGNQTEKIAGNLEIRISGTAKITVAGKAEVSSSTEIRASAPKIYLN